MRHFILMEPFRKADVSIFDDNVVGRQNADRLVARARAEGKQVAWLTQTGTINDLTGKLRSLRQSFEDKQRQEAHVCDPAAGCDLTTGSEQ